jgi:exopolysaccharide biosynthesis polyprenyl glycosylphosphotransferase
VAVDAHIPPFTAIFAAWILVFFIAGLYDRRKLRNSLEFFKTLGLAWMIAMALSLAFFYTVPTVGISPKTTLVLFAITSLVITTEWRRLFNHSVASADSAIKLLILGQGASFDELRQAVLENPQLGFNLLSKTDIDIASNPQELQNVLRSMNVEMLVIPSHLKKDSLLASALYQELQRGLQVVDAARFGEITVKKILLSEVEHSWLLDNLSAMRFYDDLKRGGELFLAVLLQIVLLPLELIIAAIIKLTSPGPVLYSQVRVGKAGREFKLYKFRSMRTDAEKNGAQWSAPGDARVTPFGKFLRASHIDEFPQLWNVIRGELSFIGPRPERPEFVASLAQEIPYFEARHLVLPGVSGWAQISYRYGSTIEDSYQKLQYDLFYIKNRSLVLDLAIALKTLRNFFVNQK